MRRAFVLAEVGVGLVAAFVGMYVGWTIYSSFADPSPDVPALSRPLQMAIVLGGIVLGASGGVALVGTLLGVRGNLPLCFLAGVMGIGAGYLLSLPSHVLANIDVHLLFVPAAAAGFAVWGFNHGATTR